MTSERGVISFPTPIYQNVPIREDFYKPKRFDIEEITLGRTTIVETTEDHDYVIGQQVRLIIPPSSGCIQLNEITAYVIEIPSQIEVRLDIDTSFGVDQYSTSTNPIVLAQILAIGDINQGAINANGRFNTSTLIPGSFQNISP
jgi:hypothetical protein